MFRELETEDVLHDAIVKVEQDHGGGRGAAGMLLLMMMGMTR